MSTPLHRAARISSGQQLLTTSTPEVKYAVDNLEYSTQASDWQVSTQRNSRLAPVHRLYNPRSHDNLYSKSAAEIREAVSRQGYINRGIAFYAYASGSTHDACANTPVYRALGPDGIGRYSDDPSEFGPGFSTPSAQFWVHRTGKSYIIRALPYFHADTSVWHAYETAGGEWKRALYNIAATPTSIWLHGRQDDGSLVRQVTIAAKSQGRVPQFVLYAIPGRDCGGFSDGGVSDITAYERWADQISVGIGDRAAIVILEPDAISFCNNDAKMRAVRTKELTYVAKRLYNNNSRVYVYLHAGSGTLTISYARDALIDSGVRFMRGFAMNVASHGTTDEEQSYGDQLVRSLSEKGFPGKKYVVDTSRNGVGRAMNPGSSYNSCNNHGAALGVRPTSETNDARADAYLWIKIPGESDGPECHGPQSGEPLAGGWSDRLARALYMNAMAAKSIIDWHIGDSPYTDRV
jgi:endoglucanase